MNHKDNLINGKPFSPRLDGLTEDRNKAELFTYTYNQLPPEKWDTRAELLKGFFKSFGECSSVIPPFKCSYGYLISVGNSTYINGNVTLSDAGPITIGNHVLIGPNCSLYAACHPIHPETRASSLECGKPVVIEDNVWLGGNVTVVPGVTIGEGSVIGAGSVVTKDIPPMSVAAGNPCKVIRQITDEDKKLCAKGVPFSAEDQEFMSQFSW